MIKILMLLKVPERGRKLRKRRTNFKSSGSNKSTGDNRSSSDSSAEVRVTLLHPVISFVIQ